MFSGKSQKQSIVDAIEKLEAAREKASAAGEYFVKAGAFKEYVLPAMEDVRKIADSLETVVGKKYWPIPTYAEMLFKV